MINSPKMDLVLSITVLLKKSYLLKKRMLLDMRKLQTNKINLSKKWWILKFIQLNPRVHQSKNPRKKWGFRSMMNLSKSKFQNGNKAQLNPMLKKRSKAREKSGYVKLLIDMLEAVPSVVFMWAYLFLLFKVQVCHACSLS